MQLRNQQAIALVMQGASIAGVARLLGIHAAVLRSRITSPEAMEAVRVAGGASAFLAEHGDANTAARLSRPPGPAPRVAAALRALHSVQP